MVERGGLAGWGGARGVGAAADPRGAPASATVLRNPRRPVGVLIWCECSIVQVVEVADFGGFAFLAERSQKGRKDEVRTAG